MFDEIWPVQSLRVRSARLELRFPTDEELARLADVAARGVHDPAERPFLNPWTDGSPQHRARAVLRSHWSAWGSWTPSDWNLELAVFHEAEPIGVQAIRAKDFRRRREIGSDSWLGIDWHGNGFGTEMRAAMLHLAFAGLGAEWATSGCFVDNHASMAVSRKLGYTPDGISRDVLHGEVIESQYFRMSRRDWFAGDRPQVMIDGLDGCRYFFGLDDTEPGAWLPSLGWPAKVLGWSAVNKFRT